MPTTVGIIELAEKVKVRRRYRGADTCEVLIEERVADAAALTVGRYMYLPLIDFDAPLAFLIEHRRVLKQGRKRMLTITGRTLDSVALEGRVVVPPVGQSHDTQTAVPAETAIKHYFDTQAVNPTDPDRVVPGLSVATDAARGSDVTTAGRYQDVLDVVLEAAYGGGLGWKCTYEAATDEHEVEVIEPTDRTASVFMDWGFGSLESWDQVDQALDATVAYVGGQGEGEDREVEERGTATGLDRREVFLDARDVPLGDTGTLQQRGDAHLAARADTTAVTVVPDQSGSFQYTRDYHLGDTVTLRDEEAGIDRAAQVVEVELEAVRSAAVPTVRLVLDRATPSERERAEGPFRGGAADQGSSGGGVVGDDLVYVGEDIGTFDLVRMGA